MISYMVPGSDIFKSTCQAITNPVNCVGVMGRGLALQFKVRYPQNFLAYQKACHLRQLILGGDSFLFEEKGKLIVNFPTKGHWREVSQLTKILDSLSHLRRQLEDRNITSVAIPPLGCGLGGLKWIQVSQVIERVFNQSPVSVSLHPSRSY